MFALADSAHPAFSFPVPWLCSLRPLFARAARAVRVAAVAGAAIAAVGAGGLDAATYEFILEPDTPPPVIPTAIGSFEVPDALVGPSNADKFIPFSQFIKFDVVVGGTRFDLPGDATSPTDGLLLDSQGEPLRFGDLYDQYQSIAWIENRNSSYGSGRNSISFWLLRPNYPVWYSYDYVTQIGYKGRYRIKTSVPKNIIIISHGWSLNGDVLRPGYLHHLTTAIQNRLSREGLQPPDTHIIEFEWPQAIDGNYFRTFNLTKDAGSRLGYIVSNFINQKSYLLGKQYDPMIHFIGHSLGTMVNAYAVQKLTSLNSSVTIEQVTILDDPLGVGYNDPIIPRFFPTLADEEFFYDILNSNRILYVENFYGTDMTPPPPRFGGPIPGSGPYDRIFGRQVFQGVRIAGANHTYVHRTFYRNLIQRRTNTGFRRLEWVSPALPTWKPEIAWRPYLARKIPPIIAGD